MATARLRFGTSSWTARGWRQTFYPPGMKPGDFLGFYSREFDTVEADVTYYRIPDRAMVARWNDVTPDDFLLSAKFPRSIVHAGEGPRPDRERVLAPAHVARETDQFLEAMAPMENKVGALVLQFPYFNRQTFADPLSFIERLDRYLEALPADFRYAVEIRNRNWITSRLSDMLRSHGVAQVLVDLPYMPDPGALLESPPATTTDFSYLRLIGDRKRVDALTTSFEAVVIDQDDRLARWSQVIEQLAARVPRLLVYANNHFAGHAPTTIRDLQALTNA